MYSFKLIPLAIQLFVCTALGAGAGAAAKDAKKGDHKDDHDSDSDSDSDDEHTAPTFFMASDTTTPMNSRGGGGWGQAFQDLLTGGASAKDFGSNIASTVTFESSGMLANLIHNIAKTKQTKATYVTVEVRGRAALFTIRANMYSLVITTRRSTEESVISSSSII